MGRCKSLQKNKNNLCNNKHGRVVKSTRYYKQLLKCDRLVTFEPTKSVSKMASLCTLHHWTQGFFIMIIHHWNQSPNLEFAIITVDLLTNIIYLTLGNTTCSYTRICHHRSSPPRLDGPGCSLLSVLLLADWNICHHVCKQGNIHAVFTDSYHTQQFYFLFFYLTNIANNLLESMHSLNSLCTNTSTVFRYALIYIFRRNVKSWFACCVPYCHFFLFLMIIILP